MIFLETNDSSSLPLIHDAAVAGLHIVDEVLDWSSLLRKKPIRELFSLADVKSKSTVFVSSMLQAKHINLSWNVARAVTTKEICLKK
jgi:hypothetical protein